MTILMNKYLNQSNFNSNKSELSQKFSLSMSTDMQQVLWYQNKLLEQVSTRKLFKWSKKSQPALLFQIWLQYNAPMVRLWKSKSSSKVKLLHQRPSHISTAELLFVSFLKPWFIFTKFPTFVWHVRSQCKLLMELSNGWHLQQSSK